MSPTSRSRAACLGSAALALWTLAPRSGAQREPPHFRHQVVDREFYGDCKAIGDLDGDGQADLVLAGGKPVSRLAWYAAPRWTRTLLAEEQQEFTTDMQVADVDADGDLDLLVPLGRTGELFWHENPRPAGRPAAAPWKRHSVGRLGDYAHDVAVGDFDGDRRLDAVTRAKDGPTVVWLQSGPDRWTAVRPAGAERGEGTIVADLNADGRPDLVQSGSWLECPAAPARDPWRKHPYAAGTPPLARLAVADLNGDRRLDVVVAPSESEGRLSWYEAPTDPRSAAWPEHVVERQVALVHGVEALDVDGDAAIDIVFAEMAQSRTKRVGYFRNRRAGRAWDLRLLGSMGSHNIRVIRTVTPGSVLILGCNWQGPPLEIWQSP